MSVLIIDPQDTSRWVEIRGKVIGMTAKNAEAHADRLAHHYTGQQHFYGDIYPVDQQAKEHRVIVLFEPVKIARDAIFR